MKSILTFFIYLNCLLLFSQQTPYLTNKDSVKKEQLIKIQKWEEQLEVVRANGDVYSEIMILPALIHEKIVNFGDNTSAYELMIYLEKLIENNPNSRAIKLIETDLNMLQGMLLRDQFRYDESLTHFKKASKLSRRDSIFDIYRDCSNHIGEIMSLMGKNEKALAYFNKLEKEGLPFDGDNKEYLTRVYQFKAEHYFRNNELDSTLHYAKKSIYENAAANMLSNRYLLIANCYLKTNKDLDSVILNAETALTLAVEIGADREEIHAHSLLKDAYGEKKDYKKAYYHFKEFYNLEQQQRSFENALQIGNINIEREKEAAKLQQALSEERLSNQRIIIWMVSSGLLLLIIGLFYIFNRLKYIRKQNKIIAKEKERAEQSEKHKEQFLANMSHEIRTPMHAISGITNTLIRNTHPKNQDVYLEAMKTSSDNLLVLLDDILDLSKIDSGELEIETSIFSPHMIIENVVKALKFRASDKGLTLNYSIDVSVPQAVVGDPSRLYQVLTNLVGNAIKFTESGGIIISLTVNNEANPMLRCCVQDTGIGIPESKIDYIFETFKQGEKSKSQIFKGTGLGLSISKKLIELQGGKIWLESTLGTGSKFFFELPLIISNEQESKKILLTDDDLFEIGNILKGIRILLAEDDDFNIMVLEDDLKYYIKEYDLTIVNNGEDAITVFENNNFDLVLMDMHMPVMGGIEATKKIRTWEKQEQIQKKTPIVAMTANIVKSEIERCLSAGMDDYLPKPYKPEALLSKLNQYYSNNKN